MALTKVGTHEGVELNLDSAGKFRATWQGREVQDRTLDGVKRKLDGLRRGRVREQAVNLPAIVIEVNTTYGEDKELIVEEIEGTFAGINAHTGEVSFTRKDGKKRGVSGHFFRADHPELPAVRELAAQAVAAYAANQRARKALSDALAKWGHRPYLGYASDKNKTEMAAKAEEQLVKALTPGEA